MKIPPYAWVPDSKGIMVLQGVLDERERCAKIAEELVNTEPIPTHPNPEIPAWWLYARKIAAKIRSGQ